MLSRAQAGRVNALKRRKIRESEGLFLAEGVRVVEDLLASGIALDLAIVSSSLEDTDRGRAVLAELAGVASVERVEEHELARLAATESPQGVLVVARAPRRELADVSVAAQSTAVVVDGVQDPGNFGTLARSAEALGADLVVALPGTVDPWNPKAVRAAAGALFRIPVVQTDFATLEPWLRERGYGIYAADAAGRPVSELGLPARVALVVGNEGAGLSEEVARAADGLVAVPLAGGAESLNVGVAAGILLYVLTRRR